MRLFNKRQQRLYLMVIPVLLLFSFGMLFAPFIQQNLPHSIIEDEVSVTYYSQYDTSGTKDVGETSYTHNSPSGWSPDDYRVTLGQVTTWDEATASNKDESYGSHDFGGNALTNEEPYYVSFDFGDGTTPVLTRTGDPTDTASLENTITVDEYLFNGDWSDVTTNWVTDSDSVGSTAQDGYVQDCENFDPDDGTKDEGWTYGEDDVDFNSWLDSGEYEGTSDTAMNTQPGGNADTGDVWYYKDFYVTSDNNVWIMVAFKPIGSQHADEIYMEISADAGTKKVVLWIDDDTGCPADTSDINYVDLSTNDNSWRYHTINVTAALEEVSSTSFSYIRIKNLISDNSGSGYPALKMDVLSIHGQDDDVEFPDFFEHYEKPYYSTNGLYITDTDGDYLYETDQSELPISIDEDITQYYWEWEIDNALHCDDGGADDYQYIETGFKDTNSDSLYVRIVPTGFTGSNDTDGTGSDKIFLKTTDTSGLIDLTDLLDWYETQSSDNIDEMYQFRTRIDSDTTLVVEEWLIYEGSEPAPSDTFDCSDMNDPTGCEFNSVMIEVSGGDAGYSLQNTDLTLSDDWSSWSVSDATGDGSSGNYTVSGSWLDVTGTFNVEFNSSIDDGDGFTVNYSNANIGCSVQDMGLQIDEATATVDNFDADGGTISYNNEGGTIIYEVNLNGTDGFTGSKTIAWAEDNYSGSLSDWGFTYDLIYRTRDYVSCQSAGITINTETPDSYTVSGGCIITISSDLDESIEFDETGTEIPDNDIGNCIFDVEVEGDYKQSHKADIDADDDDLGRMEVRYTREVSGGSTPTLGSSPVRFWFSDEFGEFGDINVRMKQPNNDAWDNLNYLTEFTVTEGSTTIQIKRAPFDGSAWENGEYEFLISFNADADAYYELTNTEAEDEIGLRVDSWKKYTDIVVKEEENTYIMMGVIENVDVREEFCFSVGQEIPNKYNGLIEKVEIWRYETGQEGEEIFTNVYETTPNSDKTKFWSIYHISPKYDDYLVLYLKTPTMDISKIREFDSETESYKHLDITINCKEEKLDNVYMELDLGEQAILPQRYNYLLYESKPDGTIEVVEGRVRDYKLYWNRDFMNKGTYRYTLYLQEKTTTEKFEYLWLTLTRSEIVTGGVTISAEEQETFEYPSVEIPRPSISLPEWQLPRLRVSISQINWGAIGERLVYYGRFASGYSSIVSAMVVTVSFVIIVLQLKTMQRQSKRNQVVVRSG